MIAPFLLFLLLSLAPLLSAAPGPLHEGGDLEEPVRRESEPQLNPQGDVIEVITTPKVIHEGGEKEGLIEGIILVPWGSDTKKIPKEHGVLIDVGKEEGISDLIPLLRSFMNAPLVGETLQEIKRTIVDFFRKKKGAYIAVIIPVQEVVNGVVVFEVLEGSVGEITYRGQKWFNLGALTRALPVKKGDPVIENELLNYVSWLNRNPFHHVEVILEPGVQSKTIHLEFISKDRFVARFFTGADNTGFQINAQTRLYAGFNWGNTFLSEISSLINTPPLLTSTPFSPTFLVTLPTSLGCMNGPFLDAMDRYSLRSQASIHRGKHPVLHPL